MWIVYNSKTGEVVSQHKNSGDAMWDANMRNDRYAVQLIRSGKARDQFQGIFGIKKIDDR